MFSLSKSVAALIGLLVVSMLLVCLIAIGTSAVQNPKNNQLEGVWKVAEVVPPVSSPSEKPTPITNPQPGLLMFTKGYYSGMAITADQPRATFAPAKDPSNLTDAEKIARYEQWNRFIANAGTYEFNGSTLTMHAMVAKNQERMTTASAITYEIKLEGPKTFWLIPTGDRAASDPRVKFTRLE
jgi:hypothetical protein